MDDFEKEIRVCFLEEATQAVADVEQCFLALESDPKNEENINKIFRLAHNLKGSSKAVGFDDFGAFTHEFETFILKIKNGNLEAAPNVVNLLLRSNDFIQQMISGLKENLERHFDYRGLLTELQNCVAETSFYTSPTTAPEAELAAPTSPDADATAEEAPAPVASSMPPAQKRDSKPPPPTGPTNADESIRVALSKVEKLINYVGEMVILQSVITEQASGLDSPSLKKTVQLLGKVSKEIQDISMGLRMMPVKSTFQKMARIVRDTALVLEKDVQLTLTGEDTELDKTVLERINDPLVHLIRNSVDHGIEKAEDRATSGKPAKGQIGLKAYHHAGRLILEVSDDGGGLNPDKLVSKAIEKGLLPPGSTLPKEEAYQLIFAPGFSTKEVVTDVSGRGVGMDVVKTNLRELGGEITISSEVQKGTTFRI